MTCQQEGYIQAYLDGELSRDERKELARHLEHCLACRTTLNELKRLEHWTEIALSESLSAEVDTTGATPDIDVEAAWSKFEARLQARQGQPTPRHTSAPSAPHQATSNPLPQHSRIGRWSTMAKTYKKWISGAVAAAVVIGALSIPQVQAAASDLLSMFRVDKFEVVRITQNDLNDIQRFLSSGAVGEKKLEGLGIIAIPSEHKQSQKFTNIADAQQLGYEPAPAPNGYQATTFTVQPEFTMRLKLDINRANGLLKQLGSQVEFDKNLDGKEFSITVPQMKGTDFIRTEAGGLSIHYVVSDQPHIDVPAGVDVNQLRMTVLQLPFIPENISRQLARIDDWQNTVPLPYVEGQNEIEKVSVNGVEGIFMQEKDNDVSLVWQRDGKLHRLTASGNNASGNNTSSSKMQAQLLDIAKIYK